MTDRSWVVIYVSQGPLGAEVAKSKLERYGVPAVLRYEAVGRALGITVDGMGRVEVLVPADEATRAETLLSEPEPRDSPDA